MAVSKNITQMSKARAGVGLLQIPPRPQFPVEMLRKFPILAEYQAQEEEWRQNLQRVLTEFVENYRQEE